MSKRRRIPGGYRSITEFFSTGSSGSCLPCTGVSSPNAADAVVDDDEASRQCSGVGTTFTLGVQKRGVVDCFYDFGVKSNKNFY